MKTMIGWLNYYAPAIQAITSMAIVVLTVLLAWATVQSTAAMRDSLRIAHDQFDREWRIDLYVEVMPWEIHSGRMDDTAIRVTNLGKASVLVNTAKFQKCADPSSLFKEIPTNCLVPGGRAETIPVKVLKPAIQEWWFKTEKDQLSVSAAQDTSEKLQVLLHAYSAGRQIETNWVTFTATFRSSTLYKLEP